MVHTYSRSGRIYSKNELTYMRKKILTFAVIAIMLAACAGVIVFQLKGVQESPSDMSVKKISHEDSHLNDSHFIEWHLFESEQSHDEYGSVTLTLKEGSERKAEEIFNKQGVEFILKNDSDYAISYHPMYLHIQKKRNGRWYYWIDKQTQADFADAEYILQPSDATSFHVSMLDLFPQSLRTVGEYRAVLSYDYEIGTDALGKNVNDSSYVFADFIIK